MLDTTGATAEVCLATYRMAIGAGGFAGTEQQAADRPTFATIGVPHRGPGSRTSGAHRFMAAGLRKS